MQTYRVWNAAKADELLPVAHAESAKQAAFIAATRSLTVLLSQVDFDEVELVLHSDHCAVHLPGEMNVVFHAELA